MDSFYIVAVLAAWWGVGVLRGQAWAEYCADKCIKERNKRLARAQQLASWEELQKLPGYLRSRL